jgi:Flp pilus assembly protein TadD
VLLLATSAIYGNTLASGFVWEDGLVIVRNAATRDLSRIGTVLLSPDEVRPYYRPLSRASYLVDHRLFGLDPRAFHAVNVLIHAASVLLLHALARRLFEARWPALLAAALLATHPIHSEAVNFVTARNNVFALAFALATLVLFVDATRRASPARAWLSGAAFFLGLASKEQAAMVLPVAAAWLFLPGTGATWRGWRAWRALVPHACAVGAYLVLRSIALGAPIAASGTAEGLLARVARNVWVMPRYLALIVWPDRLTIFHASAPPDGPGAIAAVALTWAGVALAVFFLVRRPTVAGTVGLLWLAANLLPISNLIPIPATSPSAERFFHAPAVGIWLIAADAALRLARAERPRLRAVAACAAVALALLASRTVARNRDWRDDVALARSAVEADARSSRAWTFLGKALKDAGDVEGAERAWRAALQIEPRDAESLAQLGTLAATRGDYAQGEALLRRALSADPRHAGALNGLGNFAMFEGNLVLAVELYRRALATPPGLVEARYNLATSLARLGRCEEARREDPGLRGERDDEHAELRRRIVAAGDPLVQALRLACR